MATNNTVDKVEDPNPSQFKKQALIVAVVLVVLGIIVFFAASALAGGIIALLGSIFGLGAQVVRDIPVE